MTSLLPWFDATVVCIVMLKILILDWILFEKIVFVFDKEMKLEIYYLGAFFKKFFRAFFVLMLSPVKFFRLIFGLINPCRYWSLIMMMIIVILTSPSSFSKVLVWLVHRPHLRTIYFLTHNCRLSYVKFWVENQFHGEREDDLNAVLMHP